MSEETAVVIHAAGRTITVSVEDMAILQREGMSQSVLVTLLIVFGEIVLKAIIDRILERHRNRGNFQFSLNDLGIGAMKSFTAALLRDYRDTIAEKAKEGVIAAIDAVIGVLESPE